MKTSKLWIGGEHLEPTGGNYFEDLNPSDQAVIANVAKGTPADIDRAVAAAVQAFATFSQTQAKEREAILCRAASPGKISNPLIANSMAPCMSVSKGNDP